QDRPALFRAARDHAFVVVRQVEPPARQVRGRRRIRVEIRTAAARRHAEPAAGLGRSMDTVEAFSSTGAQRGLLDAVDDHMQLAGSNCMEILLFSLGGTETFGINVFKVREVTLTPKITRTPHMPPGVQGVISLRGSVIPVIDLARVLGVEAQSERRCSTLMVSECCGRTQGFLV